jgi:hypothetical protein
MVGVGVLMRAQSRMQVALIRVEAIEGWLVLVAVVVVVLGVLVWVH